MTKSFIPKVILVAVGLAAHAVGTASTASAYGTPRTGPCPDRVVTVNAPATMYVAHGTKPTTWWGQNAWLYLETNGEPGLQRQDAHCDDPGGSHDTVLASTRITCTCDYPFGYFPLDDADTVTWWLWWHLLPVLLQLPPLPL